MIFALKNQALLELSVIFIKINKAYDAEAVFFCNIYVMDTTQKTQEGLELVSNVALLLSEISRSMAWKTKKLV